MKTISPTNISQMSDKAISIRNSWAKKEPEIFNKITKDKDLSILINSMAQMFADDSVK